MNHYPCEQSISAIKTALIERYQIVYGTLGAINVSEFVTGADKDMVFDVSVDVPVITDFKLMTTRTEPVSIELHTVDDVEELLPPKLAAYERLVDERVEFTVQWIVNTYNIEQWRVVHDYRKPNRMLVRGIHIAQKFNLGMDAFDVDDATFVDRVEKKVAKLKSKIR